MPFYRLLDQERTPVYTLVACLVTVGVETVIFLAAASLPGSGFGAIGIIYLTALLVLAGVVGNVLLGSLAHRRGEYWGGRIAAAGIVVWLLTISGFVVPPRYRAREQERSRTWGQVGSIGDVIVQGDGKIVLLGAGMVRLLPDGQPDPSFHRDYSFKKGGSLPEPPRNYWPTDGCAISLPNNDLLLGLNGRVSRVLADGRDGASFSVRPTSGSTCWGLAVESNGNVLTGWAFGPGGSRFSINLPDGSADPKFQSVVIPWFRKGEIAVQPSGKILLAGWVRSVDRVIIPPSLSEATPCFAALTRLNTDGSLDESFHGSQQCRSRNEAAPAPGLGPFAVLSDESMIVASNAQHKIVISAEISHVDSNGIEIRKSSLRGALQSFIVVSALVPMNDGRILVGGQRTPTGGAIVERLLANGTEDPTFRTHGRASYVQKILLQGEKILVLDGNGHLYRLNSDGSSDPAFRIPVLKVYSH